MGNLIIGVGNTGTNIIKLAATSNLLDETKFYAIDSVASSIDAAFISKINFIPIISDEKTGSIFRAAFSNAFFVQPPAGWIALYVSGEIRFTAT